MIIYSTKLWLQTDMNQVLDVISPWVSRKMTRIELSDIQETHHADHKIFHLEVEACRQEYPELFSLQLSHPDRDPEAAGRTWVTEIGLLQNTTVREVECTIQLQVNFSSSHVDAEFATTRPVIVQELLKRCNPIYPTAGIQLEHISQDNLIDATSHLWQQIDNPERFYPIVLVSPEHDGNYIIDPGELQYQLGGLADVVQIMPDADTREMEKMLTTEYAVWNGALNIIFAPRHRKQHSEGIPRHRMLADELLQLCDGVDEPAKSILAIVYHYASLARRWDFITPQHVIQYRVNQHLLHSSTEQADRMAQQAALMETMEQQIKALEIEKSQLQDAVEDSEFHSMVQDETIAERDGRIAYLETQLNQQGIDVQNSELHDATRHYMQHYYKLEDSKQFTLEDCLTLIKALYPERVHILQSAYKSAQDARGYRKPDDAFELLLRLVTDYWRGMKEGYGDLDAFKTFSNGVFAAQESTRNVNDANEVARRTFPYNGQDIFMKRHLKLGVASDKEITWRCHFHWDSDTARIIIGHCGKHL